ncbi:MAG: DNA-formamidopyrimidine glycosylase family protein [Dermatophilaceae bacterium]
MPEGDTVWRTAARLHEALAGQVLTVADLRWPGVATVELTGARTLQVRARGKHLLHRLSSGLTVHSHLRMEGQWRIAATAAVSPGRLADPDLRAVLGTDRWTALGLRLGMLDVVATDAEGTLVGHLGPDLLGPDWDPTQAAARVARSGTDLGSALLDQRNLAGLGTMYTAEVLFLTGRHPWAPAGDVPPDELVGLLERAHRLLDVGRRHAVQSTTGDRRRGHTTYVHAKAGMPCRRCGGTVRACPIGPPLRERVMFYCPSCQGGLAPGDDGRAQRPTATTPRRPTPPTGARPGPRAPRWRPAAPGR